MLGYGRVAPMPVVQKHVVCARQCQFVSQRSWLCSRDSLSIFSNSIFNWVMGTKNREQATVVSPAEVKEILDVSMFLNQVVDSAELLAPDGQKVPLPLEVLELLRRVITIMGRGKAVAIAPIDQHLTTQEAADYLGMSRPTFVKLLEEQRLPFTRTAGGRHRRVLLRDVIAYQERARADRRKALDELTAQAHEAGLYDDSVESYRDVLKGVRKETQSD